MTSGRRKFLRWTIGGVAGLAAADAVRLDAAPVHFAGADEAWLAYLAGKPHKTIMDVMHFFPDGTPYRRGKNLLNVLRDSYQAAEGDIGLAIGMHGRGLAHALSQAAWEDFGLVEWLMPQLNSAEQATLKTSGSSVATAAAASVTELRKRGVRFLACRNTISSWAQRISTAKGESVAASTERIMKGLHEGVEPVPAMVAAVIVAQERGVKYIALA